MVKCDGCPLWHRQDEEIVCGLTGEFICYDGDPKINDNCELLEIKLKDGAVYQPEVIDE